MASLGAKNSAYFLNFWAVILTHVRSLSDPSERICNLWEAKTHREAVGIAQEDLPEDDKEGILRAIYETAQEELGKFLAEKGLF
ncbi:MAG: hypothetical protein AAF975_04000 [Spirochaetota bacterium]